MRLIAIKFLAGLLLILLPVFGALFGYVLSVFLRLGSTGTFRLTNTGAILLAPTPQFATEGLGLGPAGFVILRGILGNPSSTGVLIALTSMIVLSFVNMGISKYIKG